MHLILDSLKFRLKTSIKKASRLLEIMSHSRRTRGRPKKVQDSSAEVPIAVDNSDDMEEINFDTDNESNSNRLEKLMGAEGRLNENTRKRRQNILEDFKNKLNLSGKTLEQFQNPSEDSNRELERLIVDYLDKYKVVDPATFKMIRPKANTLEFIRSNLKCALSDLTGLNFGDKVAFRGLANATSALHKEIKQAGRAETTHYPAIPDETLDGIFELGANVYKLMHARYTLDQAKYDEALGTIPEMYRNNYHVLFSLVFQFIVTYFDGRRGAEGIEHLTKQHWVLVDENGRKYLKKVRGERSKNWQKGSENLENSGIIMDYTDPKSGLNALEFYLLYVEHLNPKLERLFQRARRASKQFQLNDFNQRVLYVNSPLGHHQIGKMLARLTEAIGKPRLTNHSIRATAIQTLIRLGMNEHEVMQFTGHKSAESLKHYNPTATIEQREERAITLQTRTKPAAIPGGSQSQQLNKSNYECPFQCVGNFRTKEDIMAHIEQEHMEKGKTGGKKSLSKSSTKEVVVNEGKKRKEIHDRGKNDKNVVDDTDEIDFFESSFDEEVDVDEILREGNSSTNSKSAEIHGNTSATIEQREERAITLQTRTRPTVKSSAKLLGENQKNENHDKGKKRTADDTFEDFDIGTFNEPLNEPLEDVEEDEKTDFIPALTQGKNSGIQDDELLMLRSEQQITFAALENQRQRMELLKKQKRTY